MSKKIVSKISLAFLLGFTIHTTIAQINFTRMAGTGPMTCTGDGGLATSANVGNPAGIVRDAAGNVYIVNETCRTIRKINTSGIITTIAGTGSTNNTGDGGQAINADIGIPEALAIDASSSNLYFSDVYNHVIRKINISSGIITTIAGNGTMGFSGDGGIATSAQIDQVRGMAVDAGGNVFISDASNMVVRKITTGGIISSVAGVGGSFGFGGDGGPATAALFNMPAGIAFDALGKLYIADQSNHRIRVVDMGTNIINTYMGDGSGGWTGDGGIATAAGRSNPFGICFDGVGNLYFTSITYNLIGKVSPSQIISTLTFSTISDPYISSIFGSLFITADATGNLYISETNIHFVIKAFQNLTTGISEVNTTAEFQTYPNPANDALTLNCSEAIINTEITNSLGQVLISKHDLFSNTINIDLSNIPNGIYVVKAETENGTVTKKIVKQ